MRLEERLDSENMELKSAILQAGRMLVEHYPDLRGEQEARPTMGLLKLVEAVVKDLLAERDKSRRAEVEIKRLTQEVADEKYRKVRALGRVSCLEIDVKNAYGEIEKLKGGE